LQEDITISYYLFMRIIKRFVISTASIYIVSLVTSGMVFAKGYETIALAGAAVALSSLIVKPVINLLILPLNLITFGLFRWVTYAVTLYLVTLVVPGFSINSFSFVGFSSYWFSIPAFGLGGLLALLAFSLSISFVYTTISWILK